MILEEIFKQKTEDVLKKFLWEFNNHETRLKIVSELQTVLFTNEGIDNIQVIDRTTNVIADSGGFYFRVLDKNTGIEYSLGEYLKTIKDEVERN